MQNILLVGEAAEGHRHLIKRIEATGMQVMSVTTASAALSLIRDCSESIFTVMVDMTAIAWQELECLTELNDLHPRVQTMLFANQDLHGELPEHLQQLDNIRYSSISFSDPAAELFILKAVRGLASGKPIEKVNPSRGISGAPLRALDDESAGQPASAPSYSDEFLRRVGLSDVPVLVHGETGVGKEVMARQLWTYSSRVNKPFLKLNCAALPSELIESELFGYEKGAFTGATSDKPGKFELAQNGTILLDEIGDMDIRLQAKLLQVLQDGEIQPLGSARVIKVNVRVMAATHRDLRGAIAQGNFREDLYYRLSVINISVSPLRERRNEILPLAEKLLLRHLASGATPPPIPEPLQRAMLAHPWPGNVRELENLMRRFLIYQDARLLAKELTDSLVHARRRRATDRMAEPPRGPVSFNHLAEESRTAESKLLIETLESARWNRRQAALRLNLDYKAFLYKLQKHGIVEAKAKRREQSV